jgi:hypothetical protein
LTKLRLEFAYDSSSRRIQKKVYVWNVPSSSYQLQSVTKFVYDRSSLLAEVDSNNTLLRSYTWGRGQILLYHQMGNSHAAGYDATNNLTSLIKTSTGTLSAQYDYDPFGNTLRITEDFATGNPFRFAGQYKDKKTDLLYYGLRFYSPVPDDIDKTVSKFMNNSSSTRQTRIRSYVVSTYTDRGTFTGRVDVSKVGPCEVQVQMIMSGGVPWLVGGPQPNIDYYYNVNLIRYKQDGADHVGATIQAKHDGFPGHELFLEFNQKVLYHRSYLPLWFSSEPAGKTAYPGPVTAVNGSRALAGQYNFQDWEDKAAYRVP